MNRSISIYLDSIRFTAAILVFIGHANYERFTDGALKSISGFGHDAVVVFFVLSGYVIAFVTDTKEKNIKQYAVSRLARLYSVVLPCLILTIILDYTGSYLDKTLYDGYWFECDKPVFRFFSSTLFLNEIWFAHIRPFTNGPFWSLSYEFWYYVLFAAIYYLKSSTKTIVIILVTLITGPKILILFPIWLLGAYTYQINKNNKQNIPLGLFVFTGSLMLFYIFRKLDGPLITNSITNEFFAGIDLNYYLRNSQNFLKDYLIGLMVAMNFIGFSLISEKTQSFLTRIEKPVKYLSNITFTLYLLHYPMLHFVAALIDNNPNSLKDQSILLFSTLLSVSIVSYIIENKKHKYKELFANILKITYLKNSP